jgi:GTP-binding protein EngB required for normal cell division
MPIRLLVSILILLAALLVLFLFLLATDTALSVWHYLKEAPTWMQAAYVVMLGILPLATLFFFWNWLRPARKKPAGEASAPEINPDQLQDELLVSSQLGVDVEPALNEIREHRRRKTSGEIHIAVYGEVSSGKSSLVRALLPEAEVETDPRAGTTREIGQYHWQAASGDRIIISDLPGFNLDDHSRALEETRRAHLVIFLCDSDLTASQMEQLGTLKKLEKPIVLALNKSDRFSGEERRLLMERLEQRSGLDGDDIVAISSGGREEVIKMLGQELEQRSVRERSPEIAALRNAVQRHLDQDRLLMESLRDTAVLLLASEKLDAARATYREEQAGELVSKYARRAVIGAMAAVAPGTDLVIQGVLATQLMRELSQLYDVPVKEMEIEKFLNLAGGKVKNATAITLAIAGNAFKAFPGLGTLSGGVVHAVAYGMIFDSLGKAAASTLASRGELRPYPAAQAFEELLHENLEAGAVRFAKLAITRKNGSES